MDKPKSENARVPKVFWCTNSKKQSEYLITSNMCDLSFTVCKEEIDTNQITAYYLNKIKSHIELVNEVEYLTLLDPIDIKALANSIDSFKKATVCDFSMLDTSDHETYERMGQWMDLASEIFNFFVEGDLPIVLKEHLKRELDPEYIEYVKLQAKMIDKGWIDE